MLKDTKIDRFMINAETIRITGPVELALLRIKMNLNTSQAFYEFGIKELYYMQREFQIQLQTKCVLTILHPLGGDGG